MNKLNPKIILIFLIFMTFSLATLLSLSKIQEFIKQFVFWLIFFLIIFSSIFVKYNTLFNFPFFQIFYFLTILFLLSLFFLPSKDRIWFSFLGFSIQPSEFAKIAFLITLTLYISKYYQFSNNIYYLFLSLLVVSPFLILIFAQPDLGMFVLIFLTWLSIIFNFLNKKMILKISLLLMIGFLIAWFFILKDYQKDRILIFFKPELDPFKSGYNLKQLRITIGSGGLLGKGYGMGTQGRLGFLPSAETDFILASFIEERGLVGFLIFSSLFIYFLYILFRESSLINAPLGESFSIILLIYFALRFLLTSAINLGIFPIIGLPIPFMSYGGSHLISDALLIAIWHNFRYQ